MTNLLKVWVKTSRHDVKKYGYTESKAFSDFTHTFVPSIASMGKSMGKDNIRVWVNG